MEQSIPWAWASLDIKNFFCRLGCAFKILGGIANHEVLALCHPDEKAW